MDLAGRDPLVVAAPMHVAVFSPYAKWSPHFETELELIQRHLDRGDHVTVLACSGEMATCDVNPAHDARTCRQCVDRRLVGLGLLSPRIAAAPFFRLHAADRAELATLQTRFADIDALKAYRVGTFDIGCAVASSLVSLFRDPDIDLVAHADLLRKFLVTSSIVYRSLRNYLSEYRVDRLYIFNGRHGPLRAALRACQERGVACYTHERGHDLQHYALFDNTFPHDRDYREAAIRAAWDDAGAESNRAEIAAKWFQGRADGDGGNWHSFVQDQQAERLPVGWDPNQRNIVVFPSSEDEFVAIGDDWRNPLYRNQSEGIGALINSLADSADNLHLYVRVHPNLAGVCNRQTRALAELSARFVTVIPAAAAVSTYALVRRAEKAVTFGSTVGIEAVYWGTVSILAGVSFYRNLGATYNPATHAELVTLIRSNLEPKPPTAALAYGYYWATFGTPFRYFQPDGIFSGTFKGQRLKRDPWTKVRTWFLRRAARRRAGACPGTAAA